MGHLSLAFLGTFQVFFDNEPVTSFESAKVRALLAYLAVESARPHPRDVLAGLLWPDLPNSTSLGNLRHALANLREAIHDRDVTPPFLLITRDTIQFNTAADCNLDVTALTPPIIEDADPQSSILNRQSATRLYRGTFLEGFSLADSPAFEESVLLKREQFSRLALSALHDLADYYEQCGLYEQAASYDRRQIELEPWDELAHQQLMRALARVGQRSKALAQYEKCCRVLAEELGVEPSRETTALYESIRQGTFERTPACTNLPIPLTSFIGRERERIQVQQMLTTTRLLTLTGAGGSGKTRLALQVATDLAHANCFKDGVGWVDLAALMEPALVPQVIAKALGVRELPNQALREALQNVLRPKQLLLVLDNCEHSIDACAQIAQGLLAACAGLKILATSREALGIMGETTWRVPELALPDPRQLPSLKTLGEYDGIRLFGERASAGGHAFHLTEQNGPVVAQICRRLDGMPLAIELAAARLKVLSLGQLAARLDDRLNLLTGGSRTALPRHQTLRATMDWSYDLLSDAERTLLRQLSVFVGGWTLEAAEAAVGQDLIAQVLDLLTALVDKSLVLVERRSNDTRYRLLETVRQYALEKLGAADEAKSVRNRHLEFFVELAGQAEPRLMSAGQEIWLDRLEVEHENFRAALAWSLEGGMIIAGLRLAGGWQNFGICMAISARAGSGSGRCSPLVQMQRLPYGPRESFIQAS